MSSNAVRGVRYSVGVGFPHSITTWGDQRTHGVGVAAEASEKEKPLGCNATESGAVVADDRTGRNEGEGRTSAV